VREPKAIRPKSRKGKVITQSTARAEKESELNVKERWKTPMMDSVAGN